eukprot:47457-Pyramimonas_sp.AAC.1
MLTKPDVYQRTASCSSFMVLKSPKGRGIQLINGAREATGDVLLFLHADSVLPPRYVEQVLTALATPVRGQLPVWGCFEHVTIEVRKARWSTRTNFQ